MLVEITIPAHNEEKILEKSITKLVSFLNKTNLEYTLTIADNASNDRTLEIAKRLAKKYKEIKVFHTDKRGKGNAIKQAWKKSKADLLCFMDADLSTDLSHLVETVHLLQRYDVVNGNRSAKESKTVRKVSRTLFSKFYNFIARNYLKIKTNDIQCGFKGIRKDVFLKLVDKTKDNGFFFDTELMVWAEKENYRIKEIPIRWHEGGNSKVKMWRTIKDFLVRLYYLKRRLKKEGLL